MERGRRQQNLVLILARSFAAQLATAVFLVDAEGTVIYFNEAAELLLGQPFIEGAGMAADEWSTRYLPRDSEGHTVPLESLPLGVTMLKRESAYGILTILGADGGGPADRGCGPPAVRPHAGLRGRHRAVLGAAGGPVSAGRIWGSRGSIASPSSDTTATAATSRASLVGRSASGERWPGIGARWWLTGLLPTHECFISAS